VNKNLKSVLVIVLVVLMAASGGLFVFTFTRQSAAYDADKVELDVEVHTRNQILTCAYKAYGNPDLPYWIAKTLVKNTGKMPVHDFRISYKVGDYTDWTSGEIYPVIIPGETVRDYCWPSLDPEKIEQLTAKTSVDLIVKYEYKGLDKPIEEYEKISLLGKNDFANTSLPDDQIYTFADSRDNYPFLAAFITPTEDFTKDLAHSIAGGLSTQTDDNDAYEMLVRIYNKMQELGVKYTQPPDAPGEPQGITQVTQFPRETIERASGTCIEMAIAFCGLLEAVGVRSYLALIPGHCIPVAEMPNSGEWYAIESTMVDSPFPAEDAIDAAAQTLSEASATGDIIYVDIQHWWERGFTPSW